MKTGKVNSMGLFGNVKRENAIIIDNMADTCKTLIKVVDILKKQSENNRGFRHLSRPLPEAI